MAEDHCRFTNDCNYKEEEEGGCANCPCLNCEKDCRECPINEL